MGKMIDPGQLKMTCLHCGGREGEKGEVECDKCDQRQQERRDIVLEILQTEINYGRDLAILQEEFYGPLQRAGLLSEDQLDSVFLNLQELQTLNTHLTQRLTAALAQNSHYQTLDAVDIGSLFLESCSMFQAFEHYCLHQAKASWSLEQLERESELLRLFLASSQADNGLVRRMPLKSFLMAPVQRVMKYPLLLSRLHQATPPAHPDREPLLQATDKMHSLLSHINAKAKGSGSVRIKRKQSELRRYSLAEKMEVKKVALDAVGSERKELCDVISCRLWLGQGPDHSWSVKRAKSLKFTPVHAVLLTWPQTPGIDPETLGNQAVVVLVKEKNGKYAVMGEPLSLDRSVVTVSLDSTGLFELQQWGRETYTFKAEDPQESQAWVEHLRQQTQSTGQWRRRRNALPDITLKSVT